MSDELPEPLTPPDCDLRDFAFMPLDVRRLLTSETWLLGSAEEKCAAMVLWCESWHQVPAASLPDNDKMLAHLSQAGSRWKKVRAHVLRSWRKCSDGRLYHPVVAEKAMESWGKKEAQRERSRKANDVRWGKPPPIGDHPKGATTTIPQASRKESVEDSPKESRKQSIVQSHKESHKESRDDPKGQGQGQGQGDSKERSADADPKKAGDERAYAWQLVDIEGRIVPAEVPMEWVGETAQTHPLVDGYAASEAFGAYWTAGKGAGATRTDRGWRQCWRGWISREKAGRSAEWINRYGYSRYLHGAVVERQPEAAE